MQKMQFVEILMFSFGLIFSLADASPNWCKLLGGGMMLFAFTAAEVMRDNGKEETEEKEVETDDREYDRTEGD